MAPPIRRPVQWTNHSQPQTLQIAVFLLYADAVILGLLRQAVLYPAGVVIVGALAGAGWGIANEKKWAYGLAIFLAAAELVGFLVPLPGPLIFLQSYGMIGLAFTVARLALLLHNESRDYTRLWFK
jgi:hypothetical protein